MARPSPAAAARISWPGMPEPAAPGRIGPNAVLQLLPVLDAAEPGLAARLLCEAGLDAPPGDHGLMAEAPAAALHRAVRARRTDAPDLLRRAGQGTAAYILAHRIPPAARAVLRLLPAPLAAPLLARTIARHAWTFAGSGRFRSEGRGPLAFELADNPLIRGEAAAGPLCHWHAAVLTGLFAALVHRDARVTEAACAAQGAPACRFVLCLDP